LAGLGGVWAQESSLYLELQTDPILAAPTTNTMTIRTMYSALVASWLELTYVRLAIAAA
jgi:hypothetical protein